MYSGLDNPDGREAVPREGEGARAASASERERRRIDIREKQLAAMDDIADSGKFLAYKKAIDDALAKDLDDPQLWLLRGNAEEANASGRGQRGGAASIAFYQRSCGSSRTTPRPITTSSIPTRPSGASTRRSRTARSTRASRPRFPTRPTCGGTTCAASGRVDDAIAQFMKADALERAYYAAEKIDPALDWHHAHNLDLLASCYEHKGQMKLAEKTMRESATLKAVSAYRAFNMRELPNFLIHRARYRGGARRGARADQDEVPAIAARRARARRAGAARARAHRRRAQGARGRAAGARDGPRG